MVAKEFRQLYQKGKMLRGTLRKRQLNTCRNGHETGKKNESKKFIKRCKLEKLT